MLAKKSFMLKMLRNRLLVYLVPLLVLFLALLGGSCSRLLPKSSSQPNSGSLKRPQSIAFDYSKRVLYVTDSGSSMIQCLDLESQKITTVAGTGQSGFNGDGILAKEAKINSPDGIVLDEFNNIYFSDSGNHRIRKIDSKTGIISTVAGTGEKGYSGSGDLSLKAKLDTPSGLGFDSHGNLIVSDSLNHHIRCIYLYSGLITTIAGTDEKGFNGDDCFVIHAQLDFPGGIAFNERGDLFFADRSNNRIRKLNSHTSYVTTEGGNGVPGFSGDGGIATQAALNRPNGIAFDNAGNLFIADALNNRIRRVDKFTKIITTVAGNGENGSVVGYHHDGQLAINSPLSEPGGIAFDADGNLFIVDGGNSGAIRRVDMKTGVITTVWGEKNSKYLAN